MNEPLQKPSAQQMAQAEARQLKPNTMAYGGGGGGNTSDIKSETFRVEFRPDLRISLLRTFMVFLGPYRRMPG
jgi:hypothetical protein